MAIYDKDNNLVQRFEYANDRMPVSRNSLKIPKGEQWPDKMPFNLIKYFLGQRQYIP